MRAAARNPFASIAHGHALAEAIVDAVREPLVVLDLDLRVIAASRSFYRTFAVVPRKTEGRTDVPTAPSDVCFLGKSGHIADAPLLPLMTHSRRRPAAFSYETR